MKSKRTLEELLAEVDDIFKDGYDAALKRYIPNKTKSELTNNGWYERK